MKNNHKKPKKLTRGDYDRMWGEGGPYSQVNLKEQTRILDGSVSRVFLVVEAEINPFTFEYVKKNRYRFLNDEPILQLLDHAEYRDEVFGYVVSAGEVKLDGEESIQFARTQADATIQTLIRMHTFVMDAFGLGQKNKFGVIEDKGRYIWNKNSGGVEAVDSGVWDNETLIGSPAGVKNNKMRFFIIIAFDTNFDLKSGSARTFAKILKAVSTHFDVGIEDVETFGVYSLLTALMPFDRAPADFIEKVIDESNIANKTPLFLKEYFVSNVKKPTPREVMDFIGNLSLKKKSAIRKKYE